MQREPCVCIKHIRRRMLMKSQHISPPLLCSQTKTSMCVITLSCRKTDDLMPRQAHLSSNREPENCLTQWGGCCERVCIPSSQLPARQLSSNGVLNPTILHRPNHTGKGIIGTGLRHPLLTLRIDVSEMGCVSLCLFTWINTSILCGDNSLLLGDVEINHFEALWNYTQGTA